MAATPHYPPEHQTYFDRGERALLKRPAVSLEEWAHYLADSSPNWRIRKADSEMLLEERAEASVAEAFLEEQQAFHLRVAQHTDKLSATRPAIVSAAHNGAEAGWGATRIALAQSWWIASELVRRHPQLLAYEMHPGGGQTDVLCVTEADSLSAHAASVQGPRVMLNRVGSIQLHHGGVSEIIATWMEALGSPTPHSMVKELEHRAGWLPSDSTPATTSKALTYRLFATVLAMAFNDRDPWDVRSEFLDTSGYGSRSAGYLAAFPSAIEAARTTPSLGIHGEPESHFWALRRGDETVAVISIEGQAHFSNGKRTDLMVEYDKHNRRITPMTVALLSNWL